MTPAALRRALLVVGLVLALLLPGIGLTHAHAGGSADQCAACKTFHAPLVLPQAPTVTPPCSWEPSVAEGSRTTRTAPLPRPASRGPPLPAKSA